MQTDFQSLFLTSFTAPELKYLIRQELETFFKSSKLPSQEKEEKDRYLNLEEAAEFIKLSRSSMYRLCNQNKIPNSKKAGKILFSEKELKQWVKDGRRKTIMEIEEDAENHLEILGQKKAANRKKR